MWWTSPPPSIPPLTHTHTHHVVSWSASDNLRVGVGLLDDVVKEVGSLIPSCPA